MVDTSSLSSSDWTALVVLVITVLVLLCSITAGYLLQRRTSARVHQFEEAMNANISVLETKLADIDKGVEYIMGYLEGARSLKQDEDS